MNSASTPARTKSSSGSGSNPGKGSVRIRRLSISRTRLILYALALLLLTSLVAFVEPLKRHPYQESGLISWFYPVEHNAHKRLQAITCDLNAIFVEPRSNTIWVVGDRGFAAFSSNDGTSWNQVELPLPEPPPDNPIKDDRNAPTTNSIKAARAPRRAPAPSTPAPGSNFKSQRIREPNKNSVQIGSAFTALESRPSNASGFAEAEGSSRGPNAGPNLEYGDADKMQPPDPKDKKKDSPNQISPGADRSKPENSKGGTTPRKDPTVQESPNVTDNTQTWAKPDKKGAAARKNPRPIRLPPATSPTGSGVSTVTVPKPASPPENFVAVRFADQTRGWILGHLGTLYSTSDGGMNWSQQSTSQPVAGAQLSDTGEITSRLLARNRLQINGVEASFIDPTPLLSRSGKQVQLLGAFVSPDSRGWAVGSQGHVFQAILSGNILRYEGVLPDTTQPTAINSPASDYWGVCFVNSTRGWVTGTGGRILGTTDGGKNWTEQKSNTSSTLKAIAFTADARLGWAAGTDGTIIGTVDGGRTWVHSTQGSEARLLATQGEHRRSLPRWYYAALLLAAGILGLAKLAPGHKPASEEESVADSPSSDRPLEAGDPDALELNAIAMGVSRFLRNENTKPPLTIAITGDWGTGKSSLLNLLRADLCRYKFRPVWFNAWHHQKEHNLLAALLQSIKHQAIPRWYLPRGFVFRLRLIVIRTRKHVIPVLLLVLLFSFLAGYELHHHGHGLTIESIAEFLTPPNFPVLLDNLRRLISDTTRIGLFVSILGVLGTCWRGVTAFGVKPGSLLSHFSGSVKLGDLEAQTSFRQKFAGQFAEVTQALGVRTMPIFIDDLDRCRPEQALEVLEAVNFLVSSGECFVVVAMARPQVEACVGISFKDVAAEMGSYNGGTTGEEARLRRRDFARQYLDKLINIEVPIPVPTEDQSKRLLTDEERKLNEPPKGFVGVLGLMVNRARPLILTTVILSVIAGTGYLSGKNFQMDWLPSSKEKSTQAGSIQASGDEPSTGDQASDRNQQRDSGNAGSERVTATTSSIDVPFETPRIIPSSTSSLHWGYWIAALGSALLVWLWFYVSLFQPDPVVRDSRTFREALRIWHRVVDAGQRTPRAIKRFRNRVRYLAMRQRVTTNNAYDSTSSGDTRDGLIPESILVALASIQHVNPEWIEDDQQFKRVFEPGPHEISSEPNMRLLDQSVANHIQEFGNWSSLAECRKAYLKMCATVRVR